MTGIYAGEGVQLLPSDALLWALARDGNAVQLSAFQREMAVFLYAKNRRDELVVRGSGFIVTEPVPGAPGISWCYLVTARHVIEQIRCETKDHNVYVRANSRSTDREMWDVVPIEAFVFHPSDLDKRGDEWLEYTDVRRYDVAAVLCPDKLINEAAVTAWASHLLLTDAGVTEKHVGQGDDLAIIGLYHKHQGTTRITPIVRAGMIAAMPSDDLVASEIGPLRAYLIEARSTGGLSGSPVVRLSEPTGISYGEFMPVDLQVEYAILGMVTSHFDAPSSRKDEWINEGIAVVTPSTDILDTLRQEAIMAERARREPEIRKQSHRVSRMDSFGDEATADDRVSLDGVEPEDALRALLKTPPHREQSASE